MTAPDSMSTTPKHSTRPARNAALMTRMRRLRAAMYQHLRRPVSQAGGDPCNDHLVEHRRAIMRPQRERSGERATPSAAAIITAAAKIEGEAREERSPTSSSSHLHGSKALSSDIHRTT